MSNENEGDGSPRRPHNMQGLLHFCTELTKTEDNTSPSQFREMDPERREFLEQAFANLTTGVAKVLAKCIQTLCYDAVTMPEEDVYEQEEAIHTIGEYVDDLNYAIDLHKIGGFPVLVKCLDSPHAVLRSGVASLIGDIAQNNEYCQQHMLDLNVVPVLLQIIDTDSELQPRIKALYALSCLVRDYPAGEEIFLKMDGFSFLMRAMQSGEEKLVIKSTFMLANLIRNNNSYKDTIISMGYIEQLTTILSNEVTDDVSHEHCTIIMFNLASSYPPALKECLRPELRLPLVLGSRLEKISGKKEYKDEEEVVTNLLKVIENGSSDEDQTNR